MDQLIEMSQSVAVRKLLVTDSDVMAEASLITRRTLANVNELTDDCKTTTQVARDLGIERHDLNTFLKEIGVQVKRGGVRHLTSKYMNKGYEKYRLFIYFTRDGKQKQRRYLVWTPKGVNFLKQLIKKQN